MFRIGKLIKTVSAVHMYYLCEPLKHTHTVETDSPAAEKY